ncbi:hypothetical protein EV363DRAFT_1258226 [Boletus edulis]|uniref:NudC domain-containing protein 1 n=1 Tax=Boletus edulis BED1 TaxID=1328754 RepID=A0AAD4BXL3_BOLED|nr:hypothetical protein EV363DRAFT_1258226 [Boletus edulis]KAF8442915.1 hypothetical protein L210DRAFT_3477050 [Boletus edulis BED1]
MAEFTPTHSLLNPKFEGYKLLLLDQDDIVRRYDLPYKITQASSYGKSPLTFQEVQSRITHNHFVLSPIKGRGIYVDTNHQVVVVDVGDTTTDPSFTAVYELPISIASPQVDLVHPEYPSAAFLDETVVFVGDGRGSLYVLDIPVTGPATLLANFELVDKDGAAPGSSTPFRVHNVIRTSNTTAVALLSSRHYGIASDPSAKHPMKCHEFDVWAARFTIPFEMQLESVLDIVWRRRGEDVPMLMTYHRARNAYFLLGSSPYRKIGDPHIVHYDPSPDEIAPIPRPEESLDAEGPPQPTKPYPYSWTQTSDVVTVAFPLPSSTTAPQIGVTFSQKTLTVHVTAPSVVEGFTIPRYSEKHLWDGIRPSTSFWTWDREGEHEFGILSIHLDKQNEGTKWSHVFAASGTSSAEADDVDVPETLDPSELSAIRETLEKYTAALREGEDASGLGLGLGLPTLAQGEMDEEVDSSVGRLALITWVGEDGSSPAWSVEMRDSALNVLSTPLPGTEMGHLSLVVKNGLDGTRHVLSDDPVHGGVPQWKHENTFSALAFVLASKRDTRFTYHASDMIFAFENGAQDRGGNVYVYRSSSPKELWAKQSVLTVGRGDGGSLLGIGAVTAGNVTGDSIICLCENELVILRNVR